MPFSPHYYAAILVACAGILGDRVESQADDDHPSRLAAPEAFVGSKAGDERQVTGVKLCWCPAGHFTMGSPRTEPERRPGENQVEVTLTKGFWTGKYEVTQGDWKRIVGTLPGPLTPGGGEGGDFAVYNVNYPEAVDFCRKLTEKGRASGELPSGWEFRLPTEAQWEYACRAGTTTATAFGDKISSKQANFKGKPYNGAEPGPSLNRATKVGSYPPNAWGLHDMHGNMVEWCRDWFHNRLPGGHGSRFVECARHEEPYRRLLTVPAGQRLDRRRLGIALRVPTEIRTRETVRPYRLSRGRGAALRRRPSLGR